MPTGYTAKLMESGEDFKSFVLRCAHAFGALIELRDQDSDALIPVFKPDPYYTEALEKARVSLAKLNTMTNEQQIAFGEKKKEETLADYSKAVKKDLKENSRLESMEKEINSWNPPATHKELKKFVLEQIGISKNGMGFYDEHIPKIKNKSPMTFFAEAVGSAERDIVYYQNEIDKNTERANERNQWVKDLKASLEKQKTSVV